MDLIRKHLMIEGHIDKECLVRILNEVTDVYRKLFDDFREYICHQSVPAMNTHIWQSLAEKTGSLFKTI